MGLTSTLPNAFARVPAMCGSQEVVIIESLYRREQCIQQHEMHIFETVKARFFKIRLKYVYKLNSQKYSLNMLMRVLSFSTLLPYWSYHLVFVCRV